ncbi:hypothetical protein ATANTOWER_024608 [Ataeniobius toweri]|uniref:Secreted protein n=1 Tax=Ataeniobius toweri TaxID=208326 RepID=A0ABU7BA45_9TELE|nr:hypothetical protein [Ataeniobius toweri]
MSQFSPSCAVDLCSSSRVTMKHLAAPVINILLAWSVTLGGHVRLAVVQCFFCPFGCWGYVVEGTTCGHRVSERLKHSDIVFQPNSTLNFLTTFFFCQKI